MLYNAFQFQWEVDLMVWLQTYIFNNPFAINVGIFFTYFGEPLMSVLVISIVYFGIDKKFGKYIGLNIMSSCVINPLIKNIFFRLRPYFINDSIKCLKKVDESADAFDLAAQGYSFPSGHTMNATAMFASIFTKTKKTAFRILCVIIPILVGISRFALGVHYPTDVIIGALSSLIVFYIFNLFLKKSSINKVMIYSGIIFGVGLFYCKTYDYFQLYGLYIGIILGSIFEDKYVNFKNTKNVLKIVVRAILGGLLFVGLEKGIKYLLAFLIVSDSNALTYFLILFRYAVSAFVTMGVYPMIFKYNILKLDDKNKDGK